MFAGVDSSIVGVQGCGLVLTKLDFVFFLIDDDNAILGDSAAVGHFTEGAIKVDLLAHLDALHWDELWA